jgi:hypothetical protein
MILACSAQTPPPPSPAPIVAAPLPTARHLEYTFSVSYFQSGESHDSGMEGGGTGGTGSGVDADFGSGGRRGTIDADVTAFTSDGGLLVGINEAVTGFPRPGERFSCIVYADGHTLCPGEIRPLTDVENSLLSFLGRGYLDAAQPDAGGHWQRTHFGRDVDVVSDYTLQAADDQNHVTIVVKTKITSKVPTMGNTVAEVKVQYDKSLSVPNTIHDEAHETLHGGTLQTTIDLQLTKDSFATPAAK